jgi:hypothetical protein
MLNKHTKPRQWVTIVVIAFLSLLPMLSTPAFPVAEASGVKEQSAGAGWTKCSGTTCTDTVMRGTIKSSSKTLSFEQTTYKKSNGKVVSRREAFARNVNFTQNGLQSASVNARIAVKQCDSKDVCKKAGSVQIKAKWTGKGKVRTDPEDGEKVRDATVTGTVDGNGLGKVDFANLSVLPK